MRTHLLTTIFFLVFVPFYSTAQDRNANQWVDSVFNSLDDDQRIAQLLVVRSSGMDSRGAPDMYNELIDRLVVTYNIGAICAFQGTPIQHATMFNRLQALAKTPVMITVDAEWGLGMRFAGINGFPYQLTMGAVQDAELVYRVGQAIGDQLRRTNIHVNYAPVVDINNNPANPVIGIRSFGENKYKVGLMGSRIMEGMQEKGIMACAKHFPGHGDVAVDSHHDLPVINKTMEQLDSLELYPFRQLFNRGVASAMVAHLYIPSIDTTQNQATSLSYNNITGLMRNQLGYQGLTFTDALEMKGVSKFYPGGEAAVQSLVAGNDMLCLPESVPQTIGAVKKAIANGRLSWELVYEKCKRVLTAKYHYVLGNTGPVEMENLVADLNTAVPGLRREVAEKALTVLKMQDGFFPLRSFVAKKSQAGSKTAVPGILYIALGTDGRNELASRLKKSYKATVIALPYNDTGAMNRISMARLKKYKKIIIGLHGVGRYPSRNFGIPSAAINLVNNLQAANKNALLLTFGNPYVNQFFSASQNLVACYEDDAIFQGAVADWLQGKFGATGTLPVTVGPFAYGSGIIKKKSFEIATPESVQMHGEVLAGIDGIASEAISTRSTPGCVVTVLRKGKLVFQKAYGTLAYDNHFPVTTETIYDLASITKIAATTLSVMKLVEEGKIDVKQTIGYYLPWLDGSDKAGLLVENLLLHQAGLNPYIPFYKEVTDKQGYPLPGVLSKSYYKPYSITITNSLYLRNDWKDTMFQRIKASRLANGELKYVYSDNDFILLGKIVEAVSGKTLDTYASENFYAPLGLTSTTFKPFEHFANDKIAPTEDEKIFREELVWGYVHDPGAAMFGNVAGHAGLFSNAADLARLFQMLLNGGIFEKKQFLKKQTINWFTSYQTPISRRGLGFDKPDKDNLFKEVDKAYPAKPVSALTYGHTGFTGTCVWVDPAYDLIYIFLSNRVNPSSDNPKLSQLNIRSRIQELIYEAIEK